MNWKAIVIKLLTHNKIRHEDDGEFIKINRDDMMRYVDDGDEQSTYTKVLEILKFLTKQRLNWGMRNDDWMWMEVIGK